jgi:hypothetical protein
MLKSLIFLKIISFAALLAACGPRTIRTNHIALDPVVEAEVKRINMERYAGAWQLPKIDGTLYLELSEDGYYGQLDDKDGQPLQADFGTIDHYKPGLMIMKTDRMECKDDAIVFLKLDQHEGGVRLLDTDDHNFSARLVAVEPRERLRSSSHLDCVN